MSEANTEGGCFEIRVLSGLHAGARRVLDLRSHTVIGRDLACDLALRDASVAGRHMMLVMLGGKVRVVGLDGKIEVNGLPIPEGRERVLRSGDRIKLGDVMIGLGDQDTIWKSVPLIADAIVQSRWARARTRFHNWLAQDEKRRQGFRAAISVGACLCVLLPVVFAVSQWSKRSKVGVPDDTMAVRQIERLLVEMKLSDLGVSFDRSRHTVVVEGYVQFEEDIQRIEKASMTASMRPTLRLYSQERIERQAQEYVQRDLADAIVRAREKGELQIGSSQALRPQYKDWLRERLLNDIPGVRKVVFNGPDYSRIQEISPDPFSILSIGPVRFLLAKNGERYFPGSELPMGMLLRRIEQRSIFIEYDSATQE
ncbi:phosphopeptide-binding protein [Burkholderia ubonensis]|uniref:FHA domain-containing protein n=1 Tax=Burkholderia ubonensis TaxID=101571 RepID=UPI000758175D|nr:FHA domain-containing protein [Burkholderia ubonensis]KVD76200.1 phosphopeptide-binding protein [Burkholderia ubonensis]